MLNQMIQDKNIMLVNERNFIIVFDMLCFDFEC